MKTPVASLWLPLLCILTTAFSCSHADSLRIQDTAASNPLMANNISNQQINAFAEDAQGHIWIGTFRGLNKYNVHEFQQYFCTDDSVGLPDNQIKDMLRDAKGRLWISTISGLCRYTDQDNFEHIPTDRNNTNGIQLLESTDGRIFLNYVSHLSVYNPTTDRMECVIPQLDPQGSLNIKCFITPDNNLWVVTPQKLYCYDSSTFQLKNSVEMEQRPWYCHLDRQGRLWLTGNNSLLLFDTRSQQFVEVPEAIRQHAVLGHSDITYVHPYGNNSLLLNTNGKGMFCYNHADNTVVHQDEEGFPFEVPDFRISCLFTDSQQNLWIGSSDQGYAVIYHYKERFNNDNYLRTFLNKKSVVSVSAEKEDILWITTLGNGLYRYDLSRRKMSAIDLKSLFPQSAQKPVRVNQLLVDADNNLWMTATTNEALKCRYTHHGLQVEARYKVPLPMSITQDRQGAIWIGTASSYVYVIRPDDAEAQAINAFNAGNGNSFTFIPGLLPLKNGNVLAAAFYKPLLLIDTQTKELKEPALDKQAFQACIKRSVFIPTALYEDSQGSIWIGTVGNGLLRYLPDSGKIESMPGAACTDISAITEDAQGNLWVSTLYGLSKYDRTTNRFTNYYEADGIGGNQFYDRASCRLADGTLVFGGTHGLTLFNPIDVQVRSDIPLLFENLKIHNRLVHPGTDAAIDKRLSLNPDIRLQHDQNGFSISFLALDYSEHGRVHYYYRLEGFDRYWINAGNNREAYYANLPAGNYTFKVRIMDNDRHTVMGENAVRVFIAPAPWATWWAYTLYVALAACLIGIFVKARMRIRAEKAAALQAEREKKQEQRVNRMNMSFFANVSHEFRTPLTMIAGPVAQLCNSPRLDGEDKHLLCIVQRSVDRMLKLVNQLLDFNKLENDTLKLKVKHTDLITVLKRQTDIFSVNARNKGISLQCYGLEDTFPMWLDEDKIDKIFGNLMSNALKFTPSGGTIKVTFDVVTRDAAARLFALGDHEQSTQYAQVSVSNTGDTIPADKLEKIFERYYQLDNESKGVYNWGTGIGLYYARSLAELHHGHIKAAQPDEGSGAVFTFILPVSADAYTEEERTPEKQMQPEAFPLPQEAITPHAADSAGPEKEGEKPYTILVVDDDTEVVHYLQALLSPYYRTVCRFNADTALKAIGEEAPDLVISDVVMPGKDGYQLCRSIKDDLQLCHIPVILVTAKTTIDDQVQGLNTGADAYVTKPFDPTYLLALVKSQLKNREKVRSLLSTATQTDKIDEDILSPQDNVFMTDLYQLMEKELSNPELDIAHMTEMLHISRTKFYYKVKGLTGENPSTFFKTYKLNRAAELIASGKYNVSEIADMTGFSTHSYFSKAFRKQFGVSPSEYHAPKEKSGTHEAPDETNAE